MKKTKSAKITGETLQKTFKEKITVNNKWILFALALALLAAIVITYSNHFHNDFHFDDSHTITNNIYIRDISNIPNFFTDVKTFGSMPDNLGYRPVVTASTAIDYKIAGGLKPFWFHMSMFVMFIIQGFLMFFMALKIFNISYKHEWNVYLALFAIGLYMLHPGNAETINYITSRSDSFSTMFVVAGIVMYIFLKRYWKLLAFIPIALGVLSKESAAMFPLLLFTYIFLFEKHVSVVDFFKGKNLKTAWSSVITVMPYLLFTLVVAVMAQLIAYTQTHNSGFLHTQASSMGYHLKYILTQPYVLLIYFVQFFVPLGLSSDPDIAVFERFDDIRPWAGYLFIIVLLVIIVYTSRKEKMRPIAFGLLWFLIASIPTSLLAALTQVANSHRLFFPYVGLTIAIPYAFYLFALKIKPVFEKTVFNISLSAICVVLLLAYAAGTYQRNEVWRTDETLWKDIVQKNPNNARALMNYGLVHMSAGNYFEAEYYFRKALAIWPRWLYLHINLGILKNAMGNAYEAEQWFLSAISNGGNNPEPHYYYARFLYEKNRKNEAITYLEFAIKLSPAHINSRELLMNIYAETEQWEKLKQLSEETLKIIPGDKTAIHYLNVSEEKKSLADIQAAQVEANPTPEGYLSLSLMYYNKGDFYKCIEACQKALALRPDYAEAYNNMCSAYNQLQMWDKGIEACEKALAIKPDYTLAKNNLNWAKSGKAKQKSK